MPRKKLIRTHEFPYHICSRSNNKEWFKIPQNQVWDYCLKALNYSYQKCSVDLHAIVLMANHYHLLVSTPDSNIDTFMFFFNKAFSDSLRVHSKRENRVFGGPYNWSLIDEFNYLYNVTRYIFQNPIRAGLVEKVEEYPYSSIFYEKNRIWFPLPIIQLFDKANTSNHMLSWYNSVPPRLEDSYIRKGLRKSSFQPAKNPNTGKKFELSLK